MVLTDWFIHDPAEGRVGPLSTDDLRERYRQRRVQRDTLVWHAGMREWQALDRVSDQVDIDDVVPDASLPPPLHPIPAAHPPRSVALHSGHAAHGQYAPPPKRGMSGCAIAVIVMVAVAIPLIAMLAAIALPAYQDYVERSRTTTHDRPFDADRLEEANALARDLIEVAVLAQRGDQTRCPGEFELEAAQVRHPRLQGSPEDGWAVVTLLGDAAGACTYEVAFRGVGGGAEGKAVSHHLVRADKPLKVTCKNLNLPAERLPPGCAS